MEYKNQYVYQEPTQGRRTGRGEWVGNGCPGFRRMSKGCGFSAELAYDRVLEQALAQQAGELQADCLEIELEENTRATVKA